MNFVFYDFETTGLSTRYDQALQFAAIQTDENLNPIEGRKINIRCNLAGHILPSPIALAVTKVKPELLLKPGQPTWYEFSRTISNLISEWGPAIWSGYNTISFDENVIRNMFYQNLEPELYKTVTNGNKRFDILYLVYAAWVCGSAAISIPTLPSGKPTAKLDTLAPHNGFKEDGAHDALVDVRATIYLAKKIKENDPELWEKSLLVLQQKELMRCLVEGNAYTLIERFGGSPREFRGVYIGANPARPKNIGLLNIDTEISEPFWENNPDSITVAVEKSPQKIRSVDLNKFPILLPLEDLNANEVSIREAARSAHDVRETVGILLRDRYANTESPRLVEDKIFEGFYSKADKSRLRIFHCETWANKYSMIENFEDDRLKDLALRILILNCPELVPSDMIEEFRELVRRRWGGEEFYGDSEKNPGNTYPSIEENLDELKNTDRFGLDAETLQSYVDFFEYRLPLSD